MQIRNFTQEDEQAYLEMSKSFYQSEAVLHPVPEQHFLQTFQLAALGNPYMRGLMIEEGGKRAGYALISFTYSNEVGGMVLLLEELYLADEFRGRGLGTKVINWIREEYDGLVKRYRLEVTQQNTGACKLYERLGFERINYLQYVQDTEKSI